jgi:hypothetical protein
MSPSSGHCIRYLCSNPKDFVYALLGIATDTQEISLRPDYSLSWQEVFTTTARTLALSGHSVLMFSGLQDLLHVLPSWVPNWLVLWDKAFWAPIVPLLLIHHLALSRHLPTFDAANGLVERLSSRHSIRSTATLLGNTLILPGVLVGIITKVLPQPGVLSTISKLQANYVQIMLDVIDGGKTLLFKTWFGEVASFTARYFDNGDAASFRILSMEDVDQLDSPFATLLGESECRWREVLHALFIAISSSDYDFLDCWEDGFARAVNKELGKMLTKREAGADVGHQEVLSGNTLSRIWCTLFPILLDKAYKRIVFATKNGYVGYGPESLEEGDIVVVLHGQRTPLILRPKSNGSRVLLGDAYVDGVMYGEILQMNPTADIEEFILV